MSGILIQPQPSAQRGSERQTNIRWAIAVCGFLVLSVLLVFSRTLSQGFCGIDDPLYIYNQPHVSGGLSWSGLVWAFTNGPIGEWYPLSMLSHMLDCQLYGLRPAGHHLSNVLLHAASAVALFLVLWRMTGEFWPSALVAAVFALHPLHVEPVAWLASRRDVLSAFFFMLTLGAYGEYVRHPRSLGRYLVVVGAFASGLMAKPMLVTLPPLLLLLDFWPLRRFGHAQPDAIAPSAQQNPAGSDSLRAPFPWLVILDKLPLLALAIGVAGVTMRTHGMAPDSLTMAERATNAVISYVAYLGQLFVPIGLSIFNAHPEAGRPAWQVSASIALLLAITAAAVMGRRSYPYFFVGWFWYVGMLVPVLGLIYVGPQSRADRYTYLSQIGLYIALVWGVMRVSAAWPARRWVFGVGSALLLAAMMGSSWRQLGYWGDDKTVWEHAVACDPKSVTAHFFLGFTLGKTDDKAAAEQYRQALEIGPNDRNIYRSFRTEALSDLGGIASRNGDTAGAIALYEQALTSNPDLLAAHTGLGTLFAKQRKLDQAIVHFQRCIELSPGAGALYCNLAIALSQQGKADEAIANYRTALEFDPTLNLAQLNLANLLVARDDIDGAIAHLRRAIENDPAAVTTYQQLAQLLRMQGKTSEAAEFDERGKKAGRRYAEAQDLLGIESVRQGKISEAIAQFQTAVTLAPEYAQAHKNLADVLALQGNIDGALAHYRRALEIDPNFAPARRSLQQLSNY